ncbi:MAG: hypothetical protein HY054_10150 [Proteobacteria bacterium]|nr:hypothetical protein [Pseudomonadota bacterium]
MANVRWTIRGPQQTLSSTQTRFLISAGLYEAGFYVAMSRAATALRAAGRNVEIHDYAAGHMFDQWQVAFAEDAVRTFPP